MSCLSSCADGRRACGFAAQRLATAGGKHGQAPRSELDWTLLLKPKILPFGYACALESTNVAEAAPELFARPEPERVNSHGWTDSRPAFAAAIARA